MSHTVAGIEACNDLDAHFDQHRRTVLAGILACNIALVAIIARDRRVVIMCVVLLITTYPASALWT